MAERGAARLDLEHRHGLAQLAGLFFHRTCGGGGFFHQRGVLLGGFVHLGDGLVDLLDAGGLFLRGGGDLAHDVGDALHRGHDLLHGLARLVDQRRALGDTADGVVDQTLDLLGGVGRALGEGAHFAGDHGEATALFAGTRRFHRRIQGQDVGLEGDAVDDADDVGDLLRGRLDPAHGLDHLADHRAALRGNRGCTGGELVGLAGVLGVLLDGGGQFLHRRGGFFEAGGLLFGPARQIVVAGSDLAGGAVDADCRGLDPRDDRRELFGGGVGIVAHGGEHALELAVHARGQVAGGDGLQQCRQRLQVAVGGGHQLVEALDHQAEVVLEALGIATHAEVACGGRAGQVLDLAVHRGQVVLDRVHGFGEHGLFAGQAVHVLGQVADRVTAHDLRQAHLDRDMRGGQGVAVVDHAPVVAREHGFVHAVADLAGVMALGHLRLRGEHRLQLALHLVHAQQQHAGLVLAAQVDRIVELAAGDGVGHADRGAQALEQLAADHDRHADRGHDHQQVAQQHRPLVLRAHGGQGLGALGQQAALLVAEVAQQAADLLHRLAVAGLAERGGDLRGVIGLRAQCSDLLFHADEVVERSMQLFQPRLLARIIRSQALGLRVILVELGQAVGEWLQMVLVARQQVAARSGLDVERIDFHHVAGAHHLVGVVVHVGSVVERREAAQADRADDHRDEHDDRETEREPGGKTEILERHRRGPGGKVKRWGWRTPCLSRCPRRRWAVPIYFVCTSKE
ncbi:hypothetical protein NB706_001007 [Xanthomonas sacchari]|nr:hypothetical protein [Xanthomonas sacchari]